LELGLFIEQLDKQMLSLISWFCLNAVATLIYIGLASVTVEYFLFFARLERKSSAATAESECALLKEVVQL